MAKEGMHTEPFTDLSRYGVELPFLSDEEVSLLRGLHATETWKVISKVKTHLLTIYGRRCIRLAANRDPRSFEQGCFEGIETFGMVLRALTEGELVPDITSKQRHEAVNPLFADEDL